MDKPSPPDPATQARVVQLLADASRRYEADDHAGAVVAYRAAALLAPLDPTALDCLLDAEQHEPLLVHRRLTLLHPSSIDHALAGVWASIRSGYPSHAARRCTELLRRTDLTAIQTRRIRCHRLDAAVRSRADGDLVADFLFLWDKLVVEERSSGGRAALLAKVVQINSPGRIEALETIGVALGADADLVRIIATKVEQLAILRGLELAKKRQRRQKLSEAAGQPEPAAQPGRTEPA